MSSLDNCQNLKRVMAGAKGKKGKGAKTKGKEQKAKGQKGKRAKGKTTNYNFPNIL